VKAYPEPSTSYGETACIAGSRPSGSPIRLYPVPFRLLEKHEQFQRYSIVRVRLKRATEDVRHESHKVDLDKGFQVIDRVSEWDKRERYLSPWRASSIEALESLQDDLGTGAAPSLALVRPREVTGLGIRLRPEKERDWTESKKVALSKTSFLTTRPVRSLERIPYELTYQFKCADDACTGHRCQILDWEAGESLRKYRVKYRSLWEQKFRERYWDYLVGTRDLQFFVGTTKQHQRNWTIIGLYYPPQRDVVQLSLV
jgi:hypothetical protein